MTNMPEAKLAREAELCYATVAMVTDYDCWHPEHEHVGRGDHPRAAGERRSRTQFGQGVGAKVGASAELVPAGPRYRAWQAIITPPAFRDPELVAKLDAVAGRVLR